MPSTRKRKPRKRGRFIVTDEVVRLIQEGQDMEARGLLGLKPWEFGSGPAMIPQGPEYDPLITELIERLRDGD